MTNDYKATTNTLQSLYNEKIKRMCNKKVKMCCVMRKDSFFLR